MGTNNEIVAAIADRLRWTRAYSNHVVKLFGEAGLVVVPKTPDDLEVEEVAQAISQAMLGETGEYKQFRCSMDFARYLARAALATRAAD